MIKLGAKKKFYLLVPLKIYPKDYNEFENRLSEILKMNISQYLSKLDRPPEYIMEFDKDSSAITKVKDHLI